MNSSSLRAGMITEASKSTTKTNTLRVCKYQSIAMSEAIIIAASVAALARVEHSEGIGVDIGCTRAKSVVELLIRNY